MNKAIKQLKGNLVAIGALLAVLFELAFPQYALAVQPLAVQTSVMLPEVVITENADSSVVTVVAYRVVKSHRVSVSAYSSTTDQTDASPCITANGFNLCENNEENVIAANFLPMGTKVRIPDLFGDRIFTVQDRMNARYYRHADVWMKTRNAAVKFGRRYTTIEVLE